MKKSRFQSFEDVSQPEKARERIAALRRFMAGEGLAAWVLPRTDAWRNEYLRACDERLAWLTGFTGSAGLLVVLEEAAALFVDGRYTLQAAEQVDTEVITVLPIADHKPADWLAERLEEGARAGFDPWLMSRTEVRRWRRKLERKGATFVPVLPDPVDTLWEDRPPPPEGEIFLHPERFAGMTVAEKLELVRARLTEADADHVLITGTESTSWLFNIRGHDIPHTPVVLGWSLVPVEGMAELFVEPGKVPEEVSDALSDVALIRPLQALEARLRELGAQGARVLVDEGHAAEELLRILEDAGATPVPGRDPCVLPKACKTEAERAGARAAHVRDGAALARFLCWLETAAADGGVDEIAAAVRLEEFRIDTAKRAGEPLFDLSFDTISAAGPHGAIVHYRVTTRSNRPLKPGELYLVDSGGQYRDGTTDVTRTVFIGPPGMEPDAEMRRHYTLVLKGMIALSRVRFPKGTTGANLDVLARQFLWAAGLDYDHGTGHGVGAFLSVHEGPQSISRIGRAEFRPGMITSNEPGFYLEGRYGIRIENLVLCREPARREGEEREMMSFETLTLCPVDRRLIDTTLLDAGELAWLDGYHRHVREALSPLLEGDAETLAWLERACAPLAGV